MSQDASGQNLNGQSAKRACVIGWPIAHSRSPLIHKYWLRHYGLEGDYLRFAVPPGELAAFLAQMPAQGLVGANVTVPHKQAVVTFCDEITPLARNLGAVNTLWRADGKLFGDNTDVAGFLANLDEKTPGWDRKLTKTVVLGAGGAARAIVAGLAQRGADAIVLVNRTPARARGLIDELTGWIDARLSALAWDEAPHALRGADLLVNTTSLGMKGQPALHIDLAALPDEAIVADIVYAPLETELLLKARASGRKIATGLGMLLHQAAPGFEHWFGVRPQVTDELRALIEADVRTAT